ncbi:hypothetical protein NP233_g3188 [Leucocoprinus birnbaumii]|uniref:NACHT domain-containing protein n=1 Tax=Leucocoprinus birnbaumii TaxID=56174 RepID=A0AAD5YT20_9AGAR|nr:hypothetical protein NP233_g3188 [Leucocoprinus birnbaumii]
MIDQSQTIIGAASSSSDAEEAAIRWLERHILTDASFDASGNSFLSICQANTRQDIRQELLSNMTQLSDGINFYCLLGPAGVGKTSIMRTIAETITSSSTHDLAATIFFSRTRDSFRERILPTIAFHLALKDSQYRSYIRELRSKDPLYHLKDLKTQFEKLFRIPCTKHGLFQDQSHPQVILIDGLDECMGAAGENNPQYETHQLTIIELISKFVSDCPSTSLVWVLASRPERYLCLALQRAKCPIINLPINSHDDDIPTYLRHSFDGIRELYPEQFANIPAWPSQADFNTVVHAASGYFQFAAVAVRFVRDHAFKTPIRNFGLVLAAISQAYPSQSPENSSQPFATLDSMYTQIMTRVPEVVLQDTKCILACRLFRSDNYSLHRMCKVLGLEEHVVYAAFECLHSVLDIPSPDMAASSNIDCYHRSFYDYLLTPSRSGKFCIDDQILYIAAASWWWSYFRILQQGAVNPTPESSSQQEESELREEALTFWAPSLARIDVVDQENKIIELEGMNNFRIRLYVLHLRDVLQQIHFDRFHKYLPDTPVDLPSKLFDSLFWLYQTYHEEFEQLVEQISLKNLDLQDLQRIDFMSFSYVHYTGYAPTSTNDEHLHREILMKPEARLDHESSIVQKRQNAFPSTPVMVWGNPSATRCAIFKIDYQTLPGKATAVDQDEFPEGVKWEVFILPYVQAVPAS